MNRFRFLFIALFGLLAFTIAPSAHADGWIHTGDSVRVKSVPFLGSFDVYKIGHDMKEKPATKSKQAVIDAAVDKRFTWTMLREVSSEKIRNALIDGFKMNGLPADARVKQFVGTFTREDIAKGTGVSITYDAAAKTTTIAVAGGGTAKIAGEDFMKAVWRIWFGKIDQPTMGDQLISRL